MAIDSLRSTFRPAAAYWTTGARPAAAPAPASVPAPALPIDSLALASRVGAPSGGAAPTFDDLEADASLPVPASEEPTGGSGSAQPTLRPGANNGSVRTLQEKLKAAGYDVGTVDGDYGPKTQAAVRAFQRAKGLGVDGVVGTRTWAALGETGTGVSAPTGESGSLMSRLRTGLANRYRGVRHQCFRYAWATAAAAGLKGIGSAIQSRAGRGNGTAYLDTMVRNGQVRVGDVIYVNRSPGADPSSSNLKYGPHWMVYLGNGMFGDQYGTRNAAAMAAFVPGRKIDTVYHTA